MNRSQAMLRPGVSGSRHGSNHETHASKCAIGSARKLFLSWQLFLQQKFDDDAALRVLKQPNNLPFSLTEV